MNKDSIITKVVVLLIGIFFTLVFWDGIWGSYVPESFSGFRNFEQIVHFLALFLVLIQSRIVTQKLFFSGIISSNAIMLTGFLFRIMHWPMGIELLSVGAVLTVLLYAIYFLKKPVKTHLDILKILWVVVTYTIVLLVVFHTPYRHDLVWIPSVFFWIMFFDFVYVTYGKIQKI